MPEFMAGAEFAFLFVKAQGDIMRARVRQRGDGDKSTRLRHLRKILVANSPRLDKRRPAIF
jgi:hypothetical protein